MRWFVGVLLALLVGVGVYVGSAVVSVSRLVEAARAGNGAEVLARTDTTRVRRSLVDQIVSAYLKQLGRDRPVKPLERLAANTYGASVADAMIAKMMTEENLTKILNDGTITSGDNAVGSMQPLSAINTSSALEILKRISPVKLVEFFVRVGENDRAGGVSFHFEGTGWRLSGVELPSAAVEILAQSLMNSKGRSS
jgi:Protein of unknown function (DUF2939)